MVYCSRSKWTRKCCRRSHSEHLKYSKTIRRSELCPDPIGGTYGAPLDFLADKERLVVPSLRTLRLRPFEPCQSPSQLSSHFQIPSDMPLLPLIATAVSWISGEGLMWLDKSRERSFVNEVWARVLTVENGGRNDNRWWISDRALLLAVDLAQRASVELPRWSRATVHQCSNQRPPQPWHGVQRCSPADHLVAVQRRPRRLVGLLDLRDVRSTVCRP